MYATARSRAGIKSFQEHAEVVLVNPAGELMEGSVTSVYFFRDGKWVTPPVTSGGQIGTTRRWLMEQGHCIEGVIEAKSLQDGEMCWISNGLRGLILCRYISNRETHEKTSSGKDNRLVWEVPSI
jgi:4-amino-4-deoxychorismate lyase